MDRLARLLRYFRDLTEVLVLNRLWGAPLQRSIAGDAASAVRQARFHAHARIPPLRLADVVARLSPQPVHCVTLPGPIELHGVGNAAYYHALASLVRAIDPKSVLEFGTYFGVGTLTIAYNSSPRCRIVTLDLPDAASLEDLRGLNSTDAGLVQKSRDRVGEAFVESLFDDRIEQVRANSLTWQAAETVRDVDLVLVDGGHSTPVVRADTENAFSVLAPGGVILWDDYFHLYPDVVAYLDQLADTGLPLQALSGTNLVIYSDRLSHGP